jgi:glycosyltransferase involved in cell wall biosynthesis
MAVSICAVIAVRNEATYLRVLLPMLGRQEIDVVIIDNGSEDKSHEIYTAYSPSPVIHIEHLPFNGIFSLVDILKAKQQIYHNITHDWVIHHDADEILQHCKEGLTLRDAIQEADDTGYNVLNSDEFVFLPKAGESFRLKNYHENITRYYFFQPKLTPRLQRAWKRPEFPSNTDSGGHVLSGDNILIYPTNHILRHYIVLGYEHAKDKYLNRVFSKEGLEKNWHGNRRNFTSDNLRLPHSSSNIYQLSNYSSKEFYKGNPSQKHFWQWKNS